jgi:hypothetical protein
LAQAPESPQAAFWGEKKLCAFTEPRNGALGTLFAVEIPEVIRRGGAKGGKDEEMD